MTLISATLLISSPSSRQIGFELRSGRITGLEQRVRDAASQMNECSAVVTMVGQTVLITFGRKVELSEAFRALVIELLVDIGEDIEFITDGTCEVAFADYIAKLNEDSLLKAAARRSREGRQAIA